ncbi:MAG: hypothetical protein NUV49_03565, partial [Patescibacteria group bacterium]|nr:hypothetical protein [Patescibacteria group bacterium]
MTDKLFRVWDTAMQKELAVENGHWFLSVDADGVPSKVYGGTIHCSPEWHKDWFTGFHDRDNTQAFQHDLIEFDHAYWTNAGQPPDTITFVATWDRE